MARFKAEVLARTLEMMLAQRKGAAAKEKKLVGALNGLLAKMGYQVVELGGRAPRGRAQGGPGRRRRRGRRAVAKRGRKRGRKTTSVAQRKAVGRRMKAYWKQRKAEAAKGKGDSEK